MLVSGPDRGGPRQPVFRPMAQSPALHLVCLRAERIPFDGSGKSDGDDDPADHTKTPGRHHDLPLPSNMGTLHCVLAMFILPSQGTTWKGGTLPPIPWMGKRTCSKAIPITQTYQKGDLAQTCGSIIHSPALTMELREILMHPTNIY